MRRRNSGIAVDPAILRAGPRVSIVGSRDATLLGVHRATQLARHLVEHGIVVVSGLAKGIDAAAHRGTISAGGRTIAVLGTPLDRVYPAEHRALQHQLMREHLVLSPYPPGSPIQKANFPRRNRVMALIAHASIIIEAGATSGTVSLGWEALRLGRPLFLAESLVQNRTLAVASENAGVRGSGTHGDGRRPGRCSPQTSRTHDSTAWRQNVPFAPWGSTAQSTVAMAASLIAP